MAWRKLVPVVLFLTLVAPVRAAGIYDQITISLPDGWSVYDQTEALSGKASPFGTVIFSAQPVMPPGSTKADAAQMGKVDTGEVPSFFVQRVEADKGMTCDKLSRTAIYNIAMTVNRDPAIQTVRRRSFLGELEPHHTDIDVGGCHGIRLELEAHKDDPAKHWKIGVRTVSDGKVLYLFSLRHRGIYFADSLPACEKAVNSVQFKQRAN